MAEITHLSKAPITEAIIDIRIDPAVNFPEKSLTHLKERLAKDYPNVEPRHLAKIEFSIMPPEIKGLEKPPQNLGLHGYFFKSEDQRNIVQFRVDGFTLNRLKPYSSWAVISEEAKRLWHIYVDVLTPNVVTRIAVRYINHMRFTLPVQSIERYFVVSPHIPEGLPNHFSSFLNKVVLQDKATGFEANVTINLEAVHSNEGAVIFDLDVYKKVNLSPDDIKIWQTFEQLRDMKNRIFFGYITEEAVKDFK